MASHYDSARRTPSSDHSSEPEKSVFHMEKEDEIPEAIATLPMDPDRYKCLAERVAIVSRLGSIYSLSNAPNAQIQDRHLVRKQDLHLIPWVSFSYLETRFPANNPALLVVSYVLLGPDQHREREDRWPSSQSWSSWTSTLDRQIQCGPDHLLCFLLPLRAGHKRDDEAHQSPCLYSTDHVVYPSLIFTFEAYKNTQAYLGWHYDLDGSLLQLEWLDGLSCEFRYSPPLCQS